MPAHHTGRPPVIDPTDSAYDPDAHDYASSGVVDALRRRAERYEAEYGQPLPDHVCRALYEAALEVGSLRNSDTAGRQILDEHPSSLQETGALAEYARCLADLRADPSAQDT